MIFSVLLLVNLNIWISVLTPRPLFKVIFFDVGQGDAALFSFKNGTQMLIDAGPKKKTYDNGSEVIGRFLHQNGIDHIDYLLITHPHNDHIGGVPWLLRNIRVNTLIDNGIKTHAAEQEEVYHLCDSLSIQHEIWRNGTQLSITPQCEVYVVSPPKDIPSLEMTHSLENHFSIIIQVVCQKHSILMCGDAEKLAEIQLRPFGEMLRSAIIKIGHHGSIGASSEFFLRQVAPKTAVISVGKYNRFNQPHPKLLKRLEALRCEIFRTDVDGAIVFEAFPDSLKRVDWQARKSGRLRFFQR